MGPTASHLIAGLADCHERPVFETAVAATRLRRENYVADT